MTWTKAQRFEYTERASEIVAKMSLEEKIALMSGKDELSSIMASKREGKHWNQEPFETLRNENYGIPSLKFCDGGRGVVCGKGSATCFPAPIMRGASFDRKLEEKVGKAIGIEARQHGANFFAGVCINLPYHPGWGRYQEVYGEDSYAIGKMGAALVKGVQAEGVIACLKHFAFNSMENSRFYVDILCDMRTEREVFLPHFKECIDAGAAGVMCAYNSYQGEKCCHSKYLITEILKKEWQFDGIVISDFFWGIEDTVKAANAGMNIEMCHTKFFGNKLLEAVKKGHVLEEIIDDAALRIIRTLIAVEELYTKKISLDRKKSRRYDDREGIKAKNAKLALKCAEEGITLIKNNRNILPISKKVKKIIVLGRLANTVNLGDRGSSRVYPAYAVTPLNGIVKAVPSANVTFYDGDDVEHIIEIVENAEAVIYVAGLDYHDEGEYHSNVHYGGISDSGGGDRLKLGIHQSDIDKIKVAGAHNSKLTVVLMGGGTLIVSDWEQYASAIMLAYYAGQEGGNAIANVLFGAANPSGKLPFVMPERPEDLPIIDFNSDRQKYEYYHGYQFLDKHRVKPYRPYGYGMSYTNFKLKNIKIQMNNKKIIITVDIKNSGTVDGAEVIQVYAGFVKSKVDRPVKTLCGFERVNLKTGQEKRVKISCNIQILKYYDINTLTWVLEDIDYEIYVGTSSDECDLVKFVKRLI